MLRQQIISALVVAVVFTALTVLLRSSNVLLAASPLETFLIALALGAIPALFAAWRRARRTDHRDKL